MDTFTKKKFFGIGLASSLNAWRSHWRLGSQLTYLVAVSLFLMVSGVLVVTSIVINNTLTKRFVSHGENIATSLAEKSAVYVLLGSPEGTRQAIDVVHSFVEVDQITVYESNGDILAQSKGDAEWDEPDPAILRELEKTVLEVEGIRYWQFIAPVFSDIAEPELEDQEATREQKQLIGMIRMRISKDPLISASNQIIFTNLIVISSFAALLLIALRLLSVRLTRPLESFVKTMMTGAHGEKSNLRVDLSGSSETRQLSESFNQMMGVLEDREAELASTRDQALAAAKLKSEFAANVSHEVRTPLNGIVGTLNLLKESGLNDKQSEYITLAESASEALMALINDILDFSRLTLDESSLAHTAFDLRSLLEELLALHAGSADAQHLDMLFYYDTNLPLVVESDPNKIRQLLNNLINNAIKFTERGSISLRAVKAIDAEGRLWIKISVIDTGIGIKPGDLTKIFLPYAQTDGSMSRKYSGTGLGLAISEKLAELLHGDIGVNSRLGQGSEFFIRLPFKYLIPASVEQAKIVQLPRRSVVIYASNQQLLDNCINVCEQERCKVTGYTDLLALESSLKQQLFERQSDSNDEQQALILLGYISKNHNPRTEYPLLYDLLDKYSLKAIIVGSAEQAGILPAGDVEFIAPPLRLTSFRSAYENLHASAQISEIGSIQQAQFGTAFPGARVLLVEDNEINQKVAQAMLDKMQCETILANNGKEALEQIARHQFDLVIMDCQMPVMNGYDATRAIRALEGDRANVAIVAMTANTGQQDQIHCFEVGMNDFIAKPIRLQELAVIIRKWIAVQPAAQG